LSPIVDLACGIPGVQGEPGRCPSDPVHDEIGIEPDTRSVVDHVGAVVSEDRDRLRVEEVHPGATEDLQRGVVDQVERAVVEDFDRTVRVGHLPPRELTERAACAGGPPGRPG
jgi:hypothetical protein